MLRESFSLNNTNKYGDRGSPCLSPLEGLNQLVKEPFYSTDMLDALTEDIIRDVDCPGKPKPLRVSSRKSQLSMSYVFSRSI